MAVSVASTMSLAGFAGADSGAERAKFESNGPFGETITRGAMTGSPSLVDASAARDAVATAAKAAVAAEPEKGLQTKEIPAPPERRPWTRARGDSGKILPRWVLPW
ncbi:MAG: hypothetical protein HY554_06870, partial [Elusimicrobia bacterium]|nr:hypothetical protein [Elusimicrobiota bacterium]